MRFISLITVIGLALGSLSACSQPESRSNKMATRDTATRLRVSYVTNMGETRNPESPEPMTAAERMRGHRARQLGDDVPKVKPVPKPGKPPTLREASLEELIDEVSDRLTGRMADDPRDTRACIPWGRPQLPDLRRPAELRVYRTLCRGVTNLGGAGNLSGPL